MVIGAESKKVLGMRARNKYCRICASNREQEHTCYRNHNGSSGSMEPAILVDLFEESLDSNLRYTEYIGDGDSSVERALKTQVCLLKEGVVAVFSTILF